MLSSDNVVADLLLNDARNLSASNLVALRTACSSASFFLAASVLGLVVPFSLTLAVSEEEEEGGSTPFVWLD